MVLRLILNLILPQLNLTTPETFGGVSLSWKWYIPREISTTTLASSSRPLTVRVFLQVADGLSPRDAEISVKV